MLLARMSKLRPLSWASVFCRGSPLHVRTAEDLCIVFAILASAGSDAPAFVEACPDWFATSDAKGSVKSTARNAFA